MTTLKIYDPSRQAEVEACFRACVGALGWAYEPEGRHADMVNIEDTYMRHGRFWCLFEGERLVGTVALRGLDERGRVAEMKRLYVLPACQGKGYGGLLFETALHWAKASGFQILRLDTRQDRSASRHLIEKHRFRRIEQYNENAFAELFYELDLDEYDGEE